MPKKSHIVMLISYKKPPGSYEAVFEDPDGSHNRPLILSAVRNALGMAEEESVLRELERAFQLKEQQLDRAFTRIGALETILFNLQKTRD